MINRLALLAAALAAFGSTGRASASDGPYDLKLFGGVTYVVPIDDSLALERGVPQPIELSRELGGELGVEWRWSHRFGIEASFGRSTHTIEHGGSSLGEVDYEPIYLGLDFHLTPGRSYDVWVAPTLVLTRFRNAGLVSGVEVEDGDEIVGATVGVDWPLGDSETWTLDAALRYADVQLGFRGGGEIAVDPIVVRFGLGARF